MKSLQGQLLVAAGQLSEPTFSQTVVLMLQHTDEGALGVVLNRPVEQTVRTLWQQVSEAPCDADFPVNLGGPVSGPLLAVHCEETLSELEVPCGVFVAATKDNLERLVQAPEHPFRLFVGHAGWAAGQLEGEIERGMWHLVPATTDLVFGDHEGLWQHCVRLAGRRFYADVLGITEGPDEPSEN
jgi:putative transcriptional regulator